MVLVDWKPNQLRPLTNMTKSYHVERLIPIMTEAGRRPTHNLKDGKQTGWKEGGRGMNRNPDPCPTEGPGSGTGEGRGKGRNRR